jgi:hypothetical protein
MHLATSVGVPVYSGPWGATANRAASSSASDLRLYRVVLAVLGFDAPVDAHLAGLNCIQSRLLSAPRKRRRSQARSHRELDLRLKGRIRY